VQHHLSEIFWAMIIIPAALIVLGAVRSQLGRAKPGPTSP
jgi:hypothetical protein